MLFPFALLFLLLTIMIYHDRHGILAVLSTVSYLSCKDHQDWGLLRLQPL